VSEEFGIPIDEEGLAGRECALTDPDGNRLRIATRRSWARTPEGRPTNRPAGWRAPA